jgi:hypothetical protein
LDHKVTIQHAVIHNLGDGGVPLNILGLVSVSNPERDVVYTLPTSEMVA